MTRTNKEEKAAYTFALGAVHKLCRLSMGGGVKNRQFWDDIVYGRPLTMQVENAIFVINSGYVIH